MSVRKIKWIQFKKKCHEILAFFARRHTDLRI